MRPRPFLSIVTLVVVLLASEASAETRQHLTDTSGPTCRDMSEDFLTKRTCDGPADFAVTFTDEGNLVGVQFGRRGKNFKNDERGMVWRGSNKAFGDVVEWRVGPAGNPVAAIIRAWEMGHGDRTVQSLKVFALNDDRACHFASVPANERLANGKAVSRAERAAGWRCSGESGAIQERRTQ